MNKRGITAIAKKAFRNSGGLKSNVSGITLAIGIVFTIAFISAIVSLFMPWREYFYHGDEAYDIVFVHTPDSLRRYINENRPEVSMYESKKYDVSAYDFVEFGKIMHEKDAFLLIYFPEDFDERIYSGSEDAPEVLTYYRTDSVLYTEWKEYIVDDYMEATGGRESGVTQSIGLAVHTVTPSGGGGNSIVAATRSDLRSIFDPVKTLYDTSSASANGLNDMRVSSKRSPLPSRRSRKTSRNSALPVPCLNNT